MSDKLGLPIRNPPISGPAVYALERRKERNDIRIFNSCGCVYCDLGLPPDMHATPCTRASELEAKETDSDA